MTQDKKLTDKLMDIARWYAMPADHLNVVKEAVKILKRDAPSASYNSVKTELDAISRQAALNILDDMVKDYIKENDFDKAQGVAWVKVQRLPSVSTEKVGIDHWEKLWDELYDWLNDTRLNISPDETVKDDIERHERLAQADMLDEVMECMLDLESRREEGETDG